MSQELNQFEIDEIVQKYKFKKRKLKYPYEKWFAPGGRLLQRGVDWPAEIAANAIQASIYYRSKQMGKKVYCRVMDENQVLLIAK